MEHSPVRGTSRCAPGAFSLTAPVFRSSRAQKGAWCARDSTWAHGPGAHGESTIFRQARSQPHHQHQKPRANQTSSPATSHTNPHQPHHQHQKPRANQASSPGNTTHQPAATASANARSHTPTASPAPENRAPTTSPTPETSAACINASCTATGRRRTFP